MNHIRRAAGLRRVLEPSSAGLVGPPAKKERTQERLDQPMRGISDYAEPPMPIAPPESAQAEDPEPPVLVPFPPASSAASELPVVGSLPGQPEFRIS